MLIVNILLMQIVIRTAIIQNEKLIADRYIWLELVNPR